MKNYIIRDKNNPERTFTGWRIKVHPLENSEKFYYADVLLSNPNMETEICEYSTLYAYYEDRIKEAKQECMDYLDEHFEIVRVDT